MRSWLHSASIACALTLAIPAAGQADEPEPVRSGRVVSRMWWWYGTHQTDDDRYLSGDEPGSPHRPRRGAAALLWIPRMVLFVPQSAVILAIQPVRLILILQDRYNVIERARRFFFNDAETFGVFPTVFYETGFGANAGLRLVHRDIFGEGEHLSIRSGFGGVNRQVYELSVDTGRRLRPFQLTANGGYEASNRRRFYTFGNVDEIREERVTGLLDAESASVAVRTRYDVRALWLSFGAKATVSPRLELSWKERLRRRTFSVGDDPDDDPPWLTDIYAASTVVGFEDQSDIYTELRASFDDTRSLSLLAKPDLPTQGGRVELWGGFQQGIGSPFRFGRAGFDAQTWIHLFGGNRVLRLRLRASAVIGEDDRIPFADFPTLGGSLLLRGYARDRFRDRLAVTATAEYRFPLVYQAAAYLFADVGRVYERVSALTFEDLRVGYGGGLIVISRSRFLAGVQIASSIDRGVYGHFNLKTTDAPGAID